MMKKIAIIGLAVLSLISCSKTEIEEKADSTIKFSVKHPEESKVTSSAFESGDKISLYAVESNVPLQIGGNYINNEMVTFNGTDWVTSKKLYWSDKNCDFYGFYPYVPSITSIEKHPFTVSVDQSGDGYETSDLLYACATNIGYPGPVVLQFHHMMSKLVVNLVKGDDFEGDIPSDAVACVYNMVNSCTVDWTTGSVAKDPEGAKKTIKMKKISNTQFEAIVVPQNIEKRTPLVDITMGGISYLLEYSLPFRAGYKHTINVTLNTSPDQEQIDIEIDPIVNEW